MCVCVCVWEGGVPHSNPQRYAKHILFSFWRSPRTRSRAYWTLLQREIMGRVEGRLTVLVTRGRELEIPMPQSNSTSHLVSFQTRMEWDLCVEATSTLCSSRHPMNFPCSHDGFWSPHSTLGAPVDPLWEWHPSTHSSPWQRTQKKSPASDENKLLSR